MYLLENSELFNNLGCCFVQTFFDRQDFEVMTTDLRDREFLKLFQAFS